uniref:ZP domain-containing protein n=1 Tax=Plectus sambesii TaxID=2011161 RepID=A0A914V5V9_9BILA
MTASVTSGNHSNPCLLNSTPPPPYFSSFAFLHSDPNGDEPEIVCGEQSATLLFTTQRPFQGRTFVKGHSTDENCFRDFTEILLDDASVENNSLTVNYDHCDVVRQRSADPIGVAVETTIVVQFHPIFLTKVDRAYRVRCFYIQVEKTVNANLEVSMLTTGYISEQYPLPKCTYTIRNGAFDGPEVSFVRVGDPVYHRWECESVHPDEPSGYGMLIHSCYVDNGQGHRVLLVDEKGCSIDPYVLGHLTYSPDVLKAYREAHVFKFADRNALFFACQVRLCFQSMGACTGITPPNCLPLKNKRSISVTSSPPPVFSQFDHAAPTFDLTANRVIVFDDDDLPKISSQHKDSPGLISGVIREEPDDEVVFCFSSVGTFAMLAVIIFGLAGLMLFGVILIVRHQRAQIFADKYVQQSITYRLR